MAEFGIQATNVGETPNAVTPKSGVVDNSKATAISGLGTAAVQGLGLYATERVADERADLEGGVRDLLGLDPGSPDEIAFGNTLSKARQVAAVGNVARAKMMIETKQRELTTKSPWLANRFRRMVNELNSDYQATMGARQAEEDAMTAALGQEQKDFRERQRWLRGFAAEHGIPGVEQIMQIPFGPEGNAALDTIETKVMMEANQQEHTKKIEAARKAARAEARFDMARESHAATMDNLTRTRRKAELEDAEIAATNDAQVMLVQNSSAYLKGFTDQFPTFAEQEKNWPEFNARARQEMYRNITLDAKGNSRQLPEATVNALMAQFDKNMEAVGEAYGPNGRGGLVIKQSNRLAAELKINTLTDFPTLAAINAAVPGIFQSGAGASLVDAIFAAKLGGNAQNATPLQEQVKAEVSTIAAGGVSLPRGGVKSREETTYEALDGINFAVKGVLPPTPLSKKTATITAAGVVVEATKPGSPVQADIDYNPDTYGNCVWTIGNEIQNCSPPDRQVIYQSLASDTFATNFQRLSPEVKAKAAPRAQKVLALYVAETENRWNGLVYKNGKITIEGAASAQQLIEVNSANKALQQLILTHKVTDPDMTPDEILQKYFKHEAVTDAGD